jgi:hypothetical protein
MLLTLELRRPLRHTRPWKAMGSSLGLTAEVGLVGVALAFGLTLLDMASAIRHISECHQSSDHGSTSGVFLPTT